MRKSTKGIDNDTIMTAHQMLVENLDLSIETVAKELNTTKANLYYRFMCLNLDPPIRIRNEKRDNEILKQHSEGKSIKELRQEFNLSIPSLYAILRGNVRKEPENVVDSG